MNRPAAESSAEPTHLTPANVISPPASGVGPATWTRRLSATVRKQPRLIIGLTLVFILALALTAQAFYVHNHRQTVESLLRQAMIDRLSLAQQSAPDPGDRNTLRPTAEHALQSLRQAAQLRPDSRLYQEALELLLVEHRGGQRVYPQPAAKSLLPREWASSARPFPWPFILAHDGKTLQLRSLFIDLQTSAARPIEGPSARYAWSDPTGALLARRFKPTAIEVLERAGGKTLLRLDPNPLAIWTPRFSPDGRLLAVVLGAPGKRFVERDTRELQVWDITARRRLAKIPLPERRWPSMPVFSGDARFLAWVTSDEVQVYVSADGKLVRKFAAPDVARAALSPQGDALAWTTSISNTSEETTVHIVRVSDAQPVHQLHSGGPVAVLRVAFTPDGRFVLGLTGYRDHDYVYKSVRQTDPRLAKIFQSYTDRVCLWDAKDGRLLARLPGRTFSNGFGSHGEVAVARSIGMGVDAEPAIDLWRPAELVHAVQREGLLDWVRFGERTTASAALSVWFFALLCVASGLPAHWWSVTVSRVKQGAINRATAFTGVVWTLVRAALGVYLVMSAVIQVLEQLVDAFVFNIGLVVPLAYAMAGLLYLVGADFLGALAFQCYTHVANGVRAASLEPPQPPLQSSDTANAAQVAGTS